MDTIQFLMVDGQRATIRPMTLEDITAIDAMHDRLSKQSLYYRYFVMYKPSLAALREQIQLSQSRGAALVASLISSHPEIIGMAYYLRPQNDSGVGEVAILVEDRFQGHGLGRALFDHLVWEAQSQDLHSLQFFILPENRRMLSILHQDKFSTERHYRDGVIEVELSLYPQMAQENL